eukprot:gene9128-12312_t
MEVPIEFCQSGKVFKAAPFKRAILLVLLIVLYAIIIPYCYITAGEPRKLAIVQAQKLIDEKWMQESAINTETVSIASNTTSATFDPIPNNLNQIESDIASVVVDEFGESNPLDQTTSKPTSTGGGNNFILSFFGPNKEQKRAKQEFEKWQKEFKEKSGEMASLPPEYLPSAWACLALFATISAHALFFLMCHWVVAFKAATQYQPAKKADDNCFVLVVPPPNRGTSAMVKMQKSSMSGTFLIEFQRQKYIYTPSNKLGENSKKYPNGVFTLFVYPINHSIEYYIAANGHQNDGEVERMTEQWGKNHLAVAIPSFLELLQLQLVSPLAIFQIFCALLWLLDEYWSYTFFTLASVLIFEATTVFQRTRTQQMLGGMSPKPSPIYIFRNRKWSILTTKDLLPGDLISLSFKKRSNNPQLLNVSNPNANTNTTTVANNSGNNTTSTNQNVGEIKPTASVTSKDDIIPCDCLLIRGSAVVNEASLTGESVPQMKESIAFSFVTNNDNNDISQQPSSQVDRLDMNGLHRVNTLFSGSSIVTVNGLNKESHSHAHHSNAVPSPPDNGAIAFVLRTGFGSSQGSLLQMIEFSQQTVSGDNRDTGLALFILFIFALIASGYVLKEGLRKKEKTTHEILLKCVIIITSVVPRQFPMQMAMAVNMALMSLNKTGIFCTEPYRVPLAGKVSHCLFDKTGTLTTDQLMPVGIINHGTTTASSSSIPELTEVVTACNETAMILAACQSLVVVEDSVPAEASESENSNNSNITAPSSTLVGDPIELAAMKGIDWSWDAKTSTATPDGSLKRQQLTVIAIRQKLSTLSNIPADQRLPQHKTEFDNLEKELTTLNSKIIESKKKSFHAKYTAIQVIQRHHFSSSLQRMSVVCRCHDQNRQEYSPVIETVTTTSNVSTKSKANINNQPGYDETEGDWFCLVKGSPEAILSLLQPKAVPIWYTNCYETLARKGLRVLALAYRQVSLKDHPEDQPRAWVESSLLFGGFIAFECKIRTDSPVVIGALIQSDHRVAMLTGDALLTSLHVARQVNICDAKKNSATLLINKSNDINSIQQNSPYWKIRDEITGVEDVIPFDIPTVAPIGNKYNLLTTEETFLAVVSMTGGKTSLMWKHVGLFKVFARMSPQGKASIIRSIQEADKDAHVFMCGDGGNDVGALKQADVGLALLSGHANANTSDELPTAVTPSTSTVTNGLSAEDTLNAHDKELKKRNDELNRLRVAHMKEFQTRYTKEQQLLLQEQIKQRTERGEFMAMFSLMKDQASRAKQAMAEENMRFMALHGQVWDAKRDGDGLGGEKGAMEKLMESMDGGDTGGGLAIVRPGDASVAAPFTSRVPSVRAVVDLIRQGRCTLLSALMQQQIMMLESIIAAYTLSALSLHNARSSERQMMASSWLIMTAAVSFSYASPLDQMHPLRPLRSLFHPAIFVSILGQAAIHILCMTLAVNWATEAMGPEKLKEVTEFFKKVKSNEIDRLAHCGEDDMMCQMQAYWMAPFLPNLLNTVCFLVETSQMISVYFANYKGRPWMKGMLENHPLFLSVFVCIGGVVVAAWEMIPQLNELIQLAPFPNDLFRYKVVLLVILTILGTFLWDRLCTFIFARAVYRASMEEMSKVGFKDFVPIFMTVGKVIAVIVLLGSGNILLIGGAIWYYRQYTLKQQQK